MPTTKPMGMRQAAVIAEGTQGTWTLINVTTSFFRHLGIEIGEGGREYEYPKVARIDRGRYTTIDGRYKDVSWKVECPIVGRGSRGTALVSRTALMEKAAGLNETVSGSTSVTYSTDEANPANSVSVYAVDRLGLWSTSLYNGIVEQLAINLSKDAIPKIVYTGKAARRVDFSKIVTAEARDADDTTVVCTAASDTALADGSSATTITGLHIPALWGTEIIEITGWAASTHTFTIARGAMSSSAASHDSGTTIYPLSTTAAGAEPAYVEDAGLWAGAHDWSVAVNGAAVKCTKLDLTINTGRSYDPLSSGEVHSTGVHNKGYEAAGQIEMILSTDRFNFLRLGDARTNLEIVITINASGVATSGSIFTITVPHAIIKSVTPPNLGANEIGNIQVSFECRDHLASYGPQVSIVET